jgi:hypothetical protein
MRLCILENLFEPPLTKAGGLLMSLHGCIINKRRSGSKAARIPWLPGCIIFHLSRQISRVKLTRHKEQMVEWLGEKLVLF